MALIAIDAAANRHGRVAGREPTRTRRRRGAASLAQDPARRTGDTAAGQIRARGQQQRTPGRLCTQDSNARRRWGDYRRRSTWATGVVAGCTMPSAICQRPWGASGCLRRWVVGIKGLARCVFCRLNAKRPPLRAVTPVPGSLDPGGHGPGCQGRSPAAQEPGVACALHTPSRPPADHWQDLDAPHPRPKDFRFARMARLASPEYWTPVAIVCLSFAVQFRETVDNTRRRPPASPL